MPSSLLSLQPELQLTIAEFLTPDLSGLHDEDVQDRYDAKGERAPSRDDEIWRRKKDNIRNLLSWSCTSRFFRTVLIPYIFKTLVLRNTNRNAASVQMIASDSEFAKYTRELRFIGYAPGDAKRDDPAFSDVENVLPNNAKEVSRCSSIFYFFVAMHANFLKDHLTDRQRNRFGKLESLHPLGEFM